MEPQRLIHRLFLSLWVLFLPFWDFGAGAALVLAFGPPVLPDLQNAGRKFRESASFWPIWGLFGLVLLGTLWHGAALDSLLRMLPLLLLFGRLTGKRSFERFPRRLLLMLYLLGGGLYRVWQGADWSVFVYRGLLEGLHQHVYIGTYLLWPRWRFKSALSRPESPPSSGPSPSFSWAFLGRKCY